MMGSAPENYLFLFLCFFFFFFFFFFFWLFIYLFIYLFLFFLFIFFFSFFFFTFFFIEMLKCYHYVKTPSLWEMRISKPTHVLTKISIFFSFLYSGIFTLFRVPIVLSSDSTRKHII